MDAKKQLHLVLGAGAVGLFLASEISRVCAPDHLLVLSKTPSLLPVKIKKQSGQVRNMDITVQSALSSHFNAHSLCVYVCTPPEVTASLFPWFAGLLQNAQAGSSVSIFFLNNGLVHVSQVQSLVAHVPQGVCFEVWRGIVLCGFLRHIRPQHIEIEYTGGKQIYIQSILNFPNRFVGNGIELFLAQLNFFDFVHTNKMRELELAKFFTNALLGLYIGPRLLPNGSFFNFMTASELKKAAEYFCQLFSEKSSGLSIGPHFVHQTFLDTLSSTTQNINSVSLAWQQKRPNTMCYFVAEIENKIKLCLYLEARLFFQDMLQRTYYQYE